MECLGSNVEQIVWDRVNPNIGLVEEIEQGSMGLLFPTLNDDETSDVSAFENILIIDATWQEANKIYNKSPYLKAAPKVALPKGLTSNYQLRRNQPEGGLCTAECVIEILKLKQEQSLAEKLSQQYQDFNTRN